MQYQTDAYIMRFALEEARAAFSRGEVPVGAVVVDPQGEIIGRGSNRVEEEQSQMAHAEVTALRAAAQAKENWRLDGCALYVTLEPCMMCISLALLSRIERVVYGASSPQYGFSLDREWVLGLYPRHIKMIASGVLADEAAALLQKSFAKARDNR